MFPYPILVCDIGGTNARFAIVKSPDEPLQSLPQLNTASFANFSSICRSVCSSAGLRPESMVICAAGPVANREVTLTNCNWRINGPQIAHNLHLAQGLLLNDFEALALTLPFLRQQDVRPIGPVPPGDTQGPRLILGPGTGLGVGTLLEVEGRYLALPAEAGHIEFAAANSEEQDIFARIDRPHRRLTAETLMSGMGLVRLHNARQKILSGIHVNHGSDPAKITQRALDHSDSVEAETIRHFWKLVAQFAGDMALAFNTRGGVTLAGGILPRLQPLLNENAFLRAFSDKAPMSHLLSDISVELIVNDMAVLQGLRALAERPEKFIINFKDRLWV